MLNVLINSFTHLKFCLADVIHNFKRVIFFRFDSMEVNDFADWCHVLSLTCLKAVFNLLLNLNKNEYNRDWRLKGNKMLNMFTYESSVNLFSNSKVYFHIQIFILPAQ